MHFIRLGGEGVRGLVCLAPPAPPCQSQQRRPSHMQPPSTRLGTTPVLRCGAGTLATCQQAALAAGPQLLSMLRVTSQVRVWTSARRVLAGGPAAGWPGPLHSCSRRHRGVATAPSLAAEHAASLCVLRSNSSWPLRQRTS